MKNEKIIFFVFFQKNMEKCGKKVKNDQNESDVGKKVKIDEQ